MQIRSKTILVTIVILSFVLLAPLPAMAETSLKINDNGSSSGNTITASENNTNPVRSNNNASINNLVNISSTTGGNSASGNTGAENTNITSGNSTTTIEIENQANKSAVDVNNCCPQSTTISQNGNGADSNNRAATHTTNQTAVSVSNNATITNTINIKATTGNNRADNTTSGNASIRTGNIRIEGKIENREINNSSVIASAGNNDNSKIVIASNGTRSTNIVTTDASNIIVIESENIADINNDVVISAATGGNTANKNTNGDVEIVTGDIDINFSVVNKDINKNVAIVDCCEKVSPSPTPKPSEKPAPSPTTSPAPPSQGSGGGNGGPFGGGGISEGGAGKAAPVPEILGQAILPVTGFSMPFRLILAVGFSLGLLGIYLRMLAKRYATQWQVDQRQVIRYVQRNHFDP